MTKQEKIIEAYGEYWDITNGNLNDDYSFDFIGSFSDYDLGTKFKIMFTGISMFRAIPFSIVGIESNNGWIKIESESNIRKLNDSQKKYYASNNEYIFNNVYNVQMLLIKYLADEITHYQVVLNPQPPIY